MVFLGCKDGSHWRSVNVIYHIKRSSHVDISIDAEKHDKIPDRFLTKVLDSLQWGGYASAY